MGKYILVILGVTTIVVIFWSAWIAWEYSQLLPTIEQE